MEESDGAGAEGEAPVAAEPIVESAGKQVGEVQVEARRGEPAKGTVGGHRKAKGPIRRIAEYQGDYPLHLESCMRILRLETQKPLAEVEVGEVLGLMEHLANRVRMPSEVAQVKVQEMWRQLRGMVREMEASTAEVGRLEGEVMSLGPAFPALSYLERRMQVLRAEHQEVAEEVGLRKKQYEEAQRVVERGEKLIAETSRMLERYSSVPTSTDPEAMAFAVECRTIGASLRSLQAMAERERAKLAVARWKWVDYRTSVRGLRDALDSIGDEM